MNIPESTIPAPSYSFVQHIRRIVRVPPPATLGLFLITVVAFVGQGTGSGRDWQWAVGLIPANLSQLSSALSIGHGQLLPAWLTLFSYMFLHGGIFHLLANMVCLWMFGILAEPTMGSKRFFLTYVVFGMITGLTLVAVIPHWASPMVGASGAITGILGAFLAFQLSDGIGRGKRSSAILSLEAISWFAIATWLVIRTIPARPDRTSSFAWHCIPFLLAWSSVRLVRGLRVMRLARFSGYGRRTERSQALTMREAILLSASVRQSRRRRTC